MSSASLATLEGTKSARRTELSPVRRMSLQWKELATLAKQHQGSVSAVESLALEGEGAQKYLVVTGGSDAKIVVSIVDPTSGAGTSSR